MVSVLASFSELPSIRLLAVLEKRLCPFNTVYRTSETKQIASIMASMCRASPLAHLPMEEAVCRDVVDIAHAVAIFAYMA
jgi:hypothetical protein